MNVLISSAGRRVGLIGIFREALASLGLEGRVLAMDMTPLSAAYHVADESFLVPACTDPEFVPTVRKECERRKVGLIVPTIDPELPVYARARSSFEAAGVRVAVSTPDVVEIGGDKLRTHEWLVEHGFQTVRQWALEDRQGLADANFPLVAKPRFGSGGIGVRLLEGPKDLEALAGTPNYLVQERAPGVEYTVDCWVDDEGRCRSVIPRRRIEVRGGEVSKGVTVWDERLQELVTRLVNELPGARGVLNVQVFVAPSGEHRVIEINPRFGGGYPLSWAAGARYAEWMIAEMIGGSGPREDALMGWKRGLTMLRYDAAVFVTQGD